MTICLNNGLLTADLLPLLRFFHYVHAMSKETMYYDIQLSLFDLPQVYAEYIMYLVKKGRENCRTLSSLI